MTFSTKGAKPPYADEHLFNCKPLGTKNRDKRFGKEPALTSYKLIKKSNNRMFPAVAAAAAKAKKASSEKKRPKAEAEPEQQPQKKKKAKKDASATAALTMDELSRDAIKHIDAFLKAASAAK